jgi:hypothetical protein
VGLYYGFDFERAVSDASYANPEFAALLESVGANQHGRLNLTPIFTNADLVGKIQASQQLSQDLLEAGWGISGHSVNSAGGDAAGKIAFQNAVLTEILAKDANGQYLHDEPTRKMAALELVEWSRKLTLGTLIEDGNVVALDSDSNVISALFQQTSVGVSGFGSYFNDWLGDFAIKWFSDDIEFRCECHRRHRNLSQLGVRNAA